MTIEFNCPHCGALMAFDSKHAGRRVKCFTCGQKCLIPARSFEKAEKVAPDPKPREDPIPGFYRAVFLDNWRVFFRRESVTPLAFVIAVVCFRFFLAEACCLNYLSSFIIWGWLFGFYLSVIHLTAQDEDVLPEIDIGTSVTFLWHVLEPMFIFSYTLFLVELPFIITLSLARSHGITYNLVWSGHTPLHLLLQVFQIGGLFLFPAAILTLAVGQDFTLLRPDYLLAPLWRAFVPYLTVVLLLVATCFVEMRTIQYTRTDQFITAKHLGLNLLVQVLAILSMRSIGLLYRHYGGYFKW
jgi:DNA-directed RNA polymerase subunit RPC12/RpoP